MNHWTHDQIRGELQLFVEGGLEAADARAVRDHLDTCPECRRTCAEILKLTELLDSTRAPELKHSLWPGVHARLVASQRVTYSPRFRVGIAFAAAAGVAIGMVLGSDGEGEVSRSDLWSLVGSSVTGGQGVGIVEFERPGEAGQP